MPAGAADSSSRLPIRLPASHGAGLGTARGGKLSGDRIEQLDTHLAALNETQLDVETLKREVGGSAPRRELDGEARG